MAIDARPSKFAQSVTGPPGSAGFQSVDIYGNVTPGPNFVPLNVPFQQLTPDQAQARINFVAPAILGQPLNRATFTRENLEAYHELIGFPGPSHDVPLGKKIAAVVDKATSKLNPTGAAFQGIANRLVAAATRTGPGFTGEEFFSKFPDISGQPAGGIGGGYLGQTLGGVVGTIAFRKNPRAARLVADASGVAFQLLAGAL